MKLHSNIPLISLPPKTEQILFLISEELKARRFIHSLEKVGFLDNNFEPHLDSLIIQYIGLNSDDETFERYTAIMDKRSGKIKDDNESIARHALKAYHQLIMEKNNTKNVWARG